ncbi:MAG: phosphonate metabolism protein/1,5-bisphosphokinase (PRPP-forming) PhnN [Alphaproteobacteria bacterium]|nr:phosphonate metabolism protein/1,5-bisphosphokinase (PRPP-forming) PhnN [Alphaproteobacteria bacterium]
MARGTLFLVVGPSGSGKDTLIDAARAALSGDPMVAFPRREITRSAEAGGEDHIAVDADTFDARQAAGAYALSWTAHGQGYGIPVSIEDQLSSGRGVVVNVSRGVLDTARRRFNPVRILSLVVPEAVLRERLITRGRETPEAVDQRVARAGAFTVSGDDVSVVMNDGPLEQTIERFLAALRACTAGGSR